MEKRRRARINQCLDELKSLILEAMKKDVSISRGIYPLDRRACYRPPLPLPSPVARQVADDSDFARDRSESARCRALDVGRR